MPSMNGLEPDFWRRKSLEQLTREEWEALCDGCARCCLHRLEDEETRQIYFTNVHCRLLDTRTGRCTDYANRSRRVPDCVTLSPENLRDPYWLPEQCAYRLLAEGRPLPDWHPLVRGTPGSVFGTSHGIAGRTVCEDEADDLEHHLVDWLR